MRTIAWNIVAVWLWLAVPAFGQPPADTTESPPGNRSDGEPASSFQPRSGAALDSEPVGGIILPTPLTFRAEYLLWWIKGGPSPNPLVTSTALDPPDITQFGSFRDPGLVVLNGVTPINYSTRSGARFTLGAPLSDAVGAEAVVFFLGTRSNHFAVFSDGAGNPPLLRPYSNINSGIGTNAAGNIDAFPGLFAGEAHVDSRSSNWGVELNATLRLAEEQGWRAGCLAGFRNINLNEELIIRDRVAVIDPAGIFPFLGNFFNVVGDSLLALDRFRARNAFYGSQVGAWGELRYGSFSLLAAGKLAFGWTHEVININGFTTFIPGPGEPTPAQTVPAGTLALPTNTGRFQNTEFAVVPEVNFELSFSPVEFVRLTLGYRFLYWSQVARPGDQIDIFLNDSQGPSAFNYSGPPGTFPVLLNGLPRPGVPYRQSDFWAQGLSFGVEFMY